MKLRILVKLLEKLLGITYPEDSPRADMFMPERLLAMALVFFAGGIVGVIYGSVKSNIVVIAVFLAIMILGVFAFLCWKNQAIRMISEEQFTYTTMFGNTRTYAFSDIRGLRRNNDSFTLFVANDKVHIESMAVLSERLTDRINKQLQIIHQEQKA